jgi:hypothetical protein
MRKAILFLICILAITPVFALKYDVYPKQDIVRLLPNEYLTRHITIYNYESTPFVVEAKSVLINKPIFIEVKPLSSAEIEYVAHGTSTNATYPIELNLKAGADSETFNYYVITQTVLVKGINESCIVDSDCEAGKCIKKLCSLKTSSSNITIGNGDKTIDISNPVKIGLIVLVSVLAFVILIAYIIYQQRKFNRSLAWIKERL